MVCPLRFVLALASAALLLYSASVLLLDTEAGEALQRRLTRSDRSWTRFLAAFFTGELIYAFYGKGAAEGEAATAAPAAAAAAALGEKREAPAPLVAAAEGTGTANAATAAAAEAEAPLGVAGGGGGGLGCEDAASALLLATEGVTAALHQRASAMVA